MGIEDFLQGLGYRSQEARSLVDTAVSGLDLEQPLDLEAILRAVLRSQAPES